MSYHTKKRFGQHFLTDTAVLTQISQCISTNSPNDLLEIGPGQGALTDYLVRDHSPLCVVELDRDLVPHLQRKYGDKINVIHADILTVNIKQVIETYSLSKKINIIGNLPYNISTPLLFHLFSQLDAIDDMIFMVQKEVAHRICATTGSKQYGRLSVMASIFVDSELLFDVAPHSFNPPPKVDSSVLRLRPKCSPQAIAHFPKFDQIVKQAFSMRRKTIGNALKGLISIDTLHHLDIDAKLRAENISAQQFLNLSEYVHNNK